MVPQMVPRIVPQMVLSHRVQPALLSCSVWSLGY